MKKSLALVLLIILTITMLGLVACNEEKEAIVIGTPDGAPALAFANLLATTQEYKTQATVTIDVVSGTDAAVTVGGKLTSDDYDVAVLPSNVAANIYNGQLDVSVLGTVTWGNLYLINKTGAMASLSELSGKKVYSISMSGIPYQLFAYLLAQNGMSIATDQDIADNNLTNKVIVEGATAPQIIAKWSTSVDYAIVAEPALTNIIAKTSAQIGMDLQQAYATATNSDATGYPQAVLVAKKSFIKNNTRFVRDLLNKMEENAEFLTTEENIALAVTAAKAINEGTALASVKKVVTAERCNVKFVRAEDCKDSVTTFLAALGITVDEDFFYEV